LTDQLTIRGLRTLPNIEALGFDWKALKKLLKKHERVWTESREVNRQFLATEQEVHDLEARSVGEMSDSILSGEEVREAADALPGASERLEELRQRSLAYEGALERLHREIVSCVTEHQEAYSGDVCGKAAEQLGEIEAAAARLQQLMAGLQALGSLADWLERPRRSFSYAQADGQPFAAILEEARASRALPQEKRPEAMGIEHPGHAAPKGPVRKVFAPFFGGS
jgi:hypothetical protein